MFHGLRYIDNHGRSAGIHDCAHGGASGAVKQFDGGANAEAQDAMGVTGLVRSQGDWPTVVGTEV
jgi:hypothetical protein